MDLYETTPGATVRGIAQDLGVERGTLRQWLARYATGRKTGADGSPAVSPLRPRRSDDSRGRADAGDCLRADRAPGGCQR